MRTLKNVHMNLVGACLMRKMSIRETREQISRIVDEVAAGGEVVVTRHGKAAARIIGIAPDSVLFPDRGSLRSALPPMTEPASDCIRELRGEARY